MKLNFQISRSNIDILYKLLTALSHVWPSGERIYIYFCNNTIIIYPEERSGFDKIYGRMQIVPIADASTGSAGFCQSYKVVSQ